MFYKTKLLAIGLVVVSNIAFAQDTPTVTDTPTATATATATSTATSTITSTATRTLTNTRTVTWTRTALSEDTETPTKTSTRTATITPTPASTFTLTSTRTITQTPTASATVTQVPHLVPGSNAGCLVLSNTPQVVGNSGGRRGMAFWANGGEMWCGYNSSLVSRTPGPNSGAHYSDGQGLSRCECQDAPLYCIADNTVQICWDQCADTTPTATVAPTATVTATATATP